MQYYDISICVGSCLFFSYKSHDWNGPGSLDLHINMSRLTILFMFFLYEGEKTGSYAVRFHCTAALTC